MKIQDYLALPIDERYKIIQSNLDSFYINRLRSAINNGNWMELIFSPSLMKEYLELKDYEKNRNNNKT